MSDRIRQVTFLDNAVLNGSRFQAPQNGETEASEAVHVRFAVPFVRDVATLDQDHDILVPAANDYASWSSRGLPETNLQFFGARLSLEIAVSGGISSPNEVYVSLGSEAATSVVLAGDEANMRQPVQFNAAGELVSGGPVPGVLLVLVQSPGRAVYLNFSVPGGIATDGIVTVKRGSTLEVLFLDITQT